MKIGYRSRLAEDAGRWVEMGLIDRATADALLGEVGSRRRGYSFTSIVIILGVVSLCFAAMTFVAANWEAMPRIMRVALLIGCLWAAYLGAVYAQWRNHPVLADAATLLGCGIFGASIMLVGQMYHMQGKAEDAVLLWAVGTLAAVILLRSTGALWLAIGLFGLWFFLDIQPDFGSRRAEINFLYLLTWIVCAGLAWWLSAAKSAHLLAMGLIFWIAVTVSILTHRYDSLAFATAAYTMLFAAISATIFSHNGGRYLKGFEASVMQYLAICVVVLTALWIGAVSFDRNDKKFIEILGTVSYIPMIASLLVAAVLAAFAHMRNDSHKYDMVFCAVWIAATIFMISPLGRGIPYLAEAYGLGISIWLIRMGGRQDLPYITRLGYGAFALVMLVIYFRTAGSLLGTSGFYLTAGLLMVLGAIFLPKLFRRLGKSEAVQ